MRTEGSITKRGNRSWRLSYELARDLQSGERRKIQETVKADSEAAARRILRKRLTARDDGALVNPSTMTLRDFVMGVAGHVDPVTADGWFAAHKRTVSPKTAERYEDHINGHIVPRLGHHKLRAVTPAILRQFYLDLLESGRKDGAGGLAPRTVKHIERLLHIAFEEAADPERGLIARNPATKKAREVIKLDDTPVEIPDDDELARLLDAASDTRLYAPLCVFIGTGLRRGELLALRWKAIDLDAATLQVSEAIEETKAGLRFKAPKTKRGRRAVALPAATVEALRQHMAIQLRERLALGLGRLDGDALVFSRFDGEPYKPRNWSKELARIAKRASVAVSAHKLRHWHLSDLLRNAVPGKVAQERAGHSSIAVTLDIYSHVMPGMQEQAAAMVDGGLRNLQNRPGANSGAKS